MRDVVAGSKTDLAIGAAALFELVHFDPRSEESYAQASAGAALLAQALHELYLIRRLLTPKE
jgi:hypothetical protein